MKSTVPALKLPLTESTKETLLALLERAERKFQSEKEAEATLEKQAGFRDKLAEEVAALEKKFKSNPTNATVLENLTLKKSQLATFNEAIDSNGHEPRALQHSTDSYRDIMSELNNTLQPLFSVYYGEVVEEIKARVRPFVQGDHTARDIAANTWFVSYFCNWKQRLVHPIQHKKCVIELSEVARKMLNGEPFFPFDAKMSNGAKA